MRKLAITVGLCALNAVGVLAGGYLTNTNQSVSFLRNPARDAVIAIDGAYSNPAGVAFMTPGWHMAFNIQSAYQTRSMTSGFGQSYGNLGLPFSTGIVNGRANAADVSKYFEGKAKAPVIPSIDLARVGAGRVRSTSASPVAAANATSTTVCLRLKARWPCCPCSSIC